MRGEVQAWLAMMSHEVSFSRYLLSLREELQIIVRSFRAGTDAFQ